MIKKIWNNPVWSSVIAAGLIYLISISYAFVVSKIENIPFDEMFTRIKNYQVSLGSIFFFFLVYIGFRIFLILLKWVFGDKLERRKRLLRMENESIDNTNNIVLRWNVYFTTHNQPSINNLEAFCNYHQPPIRFLNRNCTEQNCPNNNFNLDIRITKNNIESNLIERWRNI